MRVNLFFLLLFANILALANSTQTVSLKVGDEYWANVSGFSYIVGVTWAWDTDYLELVDDSYSTSGMAKFKAVKKTSSSGAMIHAQVRYQKPNTNGSFTGYCDWKVNIASSGAGIDDDSNTPSTATVTFSPSNFYVRPGEISNFDIVINGNYAGGRKWSVSKPFTVTVNDYGNMGSVSVAEAGDFTFSLTLDNGYSTIGHVHSSKTPWTESISIPTKITITEGESKAITPIIEPKDAVPSLSWYTHDKSIATISSSGLVKGINPGKTYIFVQTDNWLESKCEVTVEKGKVSLSANPPGGYYPAGTQITLNANKSDARIYYTLDGSTPSELSTLYESPITLEQDITLKAIVKSDAHLDSDILNVCYKIQSLLPLVCYPEISDSEVDKSVRPSVTFTCNVYKDESFSDIRCQNIDGQCVEGEVFINDNSVIFVPHEDLAPLCTYTLIIPDGAVATEAGQVNKEVSLSFKVADYQQSRITSVGDNHAIRDNGSLWMWNYSDGKDFDTWLPDVISEPQQVMSDINYFHLRSFENVFIKKDKSLWGWGSNINGYLDGGNKKKLPNPILIAKGVVEYQSKYHFGFLKDDKSLWLWGENRMGEIGNGLCGVLDQGATVYTPYHVMDNVIKFKLGNFCTMALKSNHNLYAWGDKIAGIKYAFSLTKRNVVTLPTLMLSDVVDFDCDLTAFAIRSDGSLWGWGYNDDGNVGNGSTSFVAQPVKIMENVKKVSASLVHSIALKEDGSLWCWGSKLNGGIGLGEGFESTYPRKVASDVVDYYINDQRVYFVKSDHTLWGWGNINNVGNVYKPTKILSDFDETIQAGSDSFVKLDGSLWQYKSKTVELYEVLPAIQSTDIIDLSILNSEISLAQDNTYPLQTILYPVIADVNLSYISEDENIAQVSTDGIIYALNTGKTRVEVIAKDHNDNTAKAYVGLTVHDKNEANIVNHTHESYLAIRQVGNELIIVGKEAGDLVEIFNINGLNVYRGSDCTINIPTSGVYIVRIKNQYFKILLSAK